MLYLACNDKKAFFTPTDHRGYKLWSFQNVCDALSYLLDTIYIRFVMHVQTNCWYSDGYKLCSSCSRFVLFCDESYFMASLSDDNQADIIETFNSTFRY